MGEGRGGEERGGEGRRGEERRGERNKVRMFVVSFAAVIRVVTQCFSPTNGCLDPNPICFQGLANDNTPHIFLRRSCQD